MCSTRNPRQCVVLRNSHLIKVCRRKVSLSPKTPLNTKGDDGNRTHDKGFADLCLTTWLRRHRKKLMENDRCQVSHLPPANV